MTTKDMLPEPLTIPLDHATHLGMRRLEDGGLVQWSSTFLRGRRSLVVRAQLYRIEDNGALTPILTNAQPYDVEAWVNERGGVHVPYHECRQHTVFHADTNQVYCSMCHKTLDREGQV